MEAFLYTALDLTRLLDGRWKGRGRGGGAYFCCFVFVVFCFDFCCFVVVVVVVVLCVCGGGGCFFAWSDRVAFRLPEGGGVKYLTIVSIRDEENRR